MAVFWKNEVDFLVDTYSSNHIDAVINKGKEGSGDSPVSMGNPKQAITIFLGPLEKTKIEIYLTLVMCGRLQ